MTKNLYYILIYLVVLIRSIICPSQMLESVCQPTDEQKELEYNGVFYCLNHIKEVCNNDEYRNDTDIQYLLNIYNISKVAVKNRLRMSKSVYSSPKTFINIESIYSSKRSYICKRVARHFYAKYYLSPPKFMLEERKRYTKRIPKRLYYSLSKYATAYQIRGLLSMRPVVVERYWLDHATFLIAKKYENSSSLPPANSTIYNWPVDLRKPDIIFYINASRSMESEGFDFNTFTERLLQVLRLMRGVRVVEVNPNKNAEVIIREIIHYIESRRDTEFQDLTSFNRTRPWSSSPMRKF